jgi:membrane-bound lytic murein transglycosylase D
VPMPASRAELAGGAPTVASAAVPAAVSGAEPTGGGVRPSAEWPTPVAETVPPPAPPEESPMPPSAQQAAPPSEPVTQRQTTNRDSLLPVASPTGNSDTTDYNVGPGNTVVVQEGETLGHFADWTGVDSQSLRVLNGLHKNATVTSGKKLKLDLSRVTAAQFNAARRDYHRHLQEAFFASHRIASTLSYTVKRGDSLWTIVQHADLPVWLVAQYNPDVNFKDIRPGTVLTLPQVAAINRQ